VLQALAMATFQKPGAYLKKFAKGGINTTTGLAWLDGTMQNPERILSPYQTGLFEDMIATLHDIRIATPKVQNAAPKMREADRSFYIENLSVQVDKLESDADYEEVARRVSEHIYEEMNRGLPVGGYRLR
jgi:hypothetical protein